jgi:hypothetical protein
LNNAISNMIGNKKVTVLALVLLIPSVVCGADHASSSGERCLACTPSVAPSEISRAIKLSAAYLERTCDQNGKFLYKVDLNSQQASPDYNIIRHAGAIYALSMFDEAYPDAKAVSTMLRAGRFMTAGYVSDGGQVANTFVVWSKPVGANGGTEAKLGATALGLVALTDIVQRQPDAIPVTELEAMGRFLTYLQKPDGSFYSRYITTRGRLDNWESLYYPGEAILALLRLYEIDHSAEWLAAAGRSMSYLAERRATEGVAPPDHWALIATAKLLDHYDPSKCPASREKLIRHAVQICETMLKEQTSSPSERLDGSFTPAGRTAPAATRLEGLLAALTFLPEDQKQLRSQIEIAVRRGILFLLRAQITDGPYAGGIPGCTINVKGSGKTDRDDDSSEVRVDYVQHALCAFLRYEKILGS